MEETMRSRNKAKADRFPNHVHRPEVIAPPNADNATARANSRTPRLQTCAAATQM